MNTSQDAKTIKTPIPCRCECGETFTPTKYGQRFINPDHRIAFWKKAQSTAKEDDYKEFLRVRDKLRRYLKYEKRINAWLKANKK